MHMVFTYLGNTHFKLLIWGVDNCSVGSAGTDETDTLEKMNRVNYVSFKLI